MEKGEEQLPTLDLKDGNIQGTTDKSSTSGVSDDIETLFFDDSETEVTSKQGTSQEEKKSIFEEEQTNDNLIDTTKTNNNDEKEEPKKEEAPKQEVKKEEPKKEEVPKQEVKKEEPKKEEAPKPEIKKDDNIEAKKPTPQPSKNGEPVKSQSNVKPTNPVKPQDGAKPGNMGKPSPGNNGKPPEKLVGKPVPPPTGKPQAPVFEKNSSSPGVPVSRAVLAERERKAKREAELAAQEARRILEEKKKAEEEARLKAEEERKAAEEAKKAAESKALEPPKEELKIELPGENGVNNQGTATVGSGSIFEPGNEPKQNEEIIDTTATVVTPNLQMTQPISIPIDPGNSGPIYVMIQNPASTIQNVPAQIIPQNIEVQPVQPVQPVTNPTPEPTIQSVQNNNGTKNEGFGSYKLNSSLLDKLSSDENLIKEYIGNNYYKITKGKINFGAFFLNSIYLLFRKMPLFALIIFAIELLAICIINQPLILIGVFLVLSVIFNKVYMQKARTTIKKLRGKYSDQYVLRRMCGKRGGTNFGFAIVGVVFEVVAILVLIFYGYGNSITKYLAEYGIDISLSDIILKVPLFNEGSEEPSSYNGIQIIDTNVIILDEMNVGVANSFKPTATNSDFRLSYSYSDNTKRINKCNLRMVSVRKYNSAETLISQIANYYKTTQGEMKNGWYNVKASTKRGTIYYYSINRENKVYLFTYTVENNAPQDCESYREEIFSTIIFRDKMVEEASEEQQQTDQQKVSN